MVIKKISYTYRYFGDRCEFALLNLSQMDISHATYQEKHSTTLVCFNERLDILNQAQLCVNVVIWLLVSLQQRWNKFAFSANSLILHYCPVEPCLWKTMNIAKQILCAQ